MHKKILSESNPPCNGKFYMATFITVLPILLSTTQILHILEKSEVDIFHETQSFLLENFKKILKKTVKTRKRFSS